MHRLHDRATTMKSVWERLLRTIAASPTLSASSDADARRGKARGHRGGARSGAWSQDKAARSGGGSFSLRTPRPSADWRWLQRRNRGERQRLCAAPSLRSWPHVPTHCSLSLPALLVSRAARRHPVTLRLAQWRRVTGIWCPHMVSLPAGRGGHEGDVVKGQLCPLRHPTPCLAVHFSARQTPAPFLRGARSRWGGRLSLGPRVHSRPVRCASAKPRWRRKNTRRLGLIRPGTLHWRPAIPLSRRAGAAGRQRVFSWVASVAIARSWIVCGRLPLRAYRRQCVAPQSPCRGSSWRQGSHLPCTSTGLLRKQPHPRCP